MGKAKKLQTTGRENSKHLIEPGKTLEHDESSLQSRYLIYLFLIYLFSTLLEVRETGRDRE